MKAARAWYEKAAAKGSSEAQNVLRENFQSQLETPTQSSYRANLKTQIVPVEDSVPVSRLANTYTYQCKVKGRLYALKLNDGRKELYWRGKTYRIRIEDSCAKFGWHAERQGEAFNFCTATQGYADFKENGSTIQCDQNR